MEQEKYLELVAEKNYDLFLEQGFATAGHNGPHGHLDTPVRNTAHYLVIYTYLYKKTGEKKYETICRKFSEYLCDRQKESESGAIKCMETDRFDHLNGLIGQGWVIEGLLYYYDVFKDENALETAREIYYSQKYDKALHLWRRIELDGRDIGIDPTYNHQVWFAACAYKLSDYCVDPSIDETIRDFLTEGSKRDFKIYSDGLLKHYVSVSGEAMRKIRTKKLIKFFLTPFKSLSPKKFELKYMEYAYHMFDLYGFSILREKYGELPLFSSLKYLKAVKYASDIKKFNRKCGVDKALEKGDMFNIFSYSYNSPAFEYPYTAEVNGFLDEKTCGELYEIQTELMYSKQTKMFTRNNYDIETWNARVYEIVRYCDRLRSKK